MGFPDGDHRLQATWTCIFLSQKRAIDTHLCTCTWVCALWSHAVQQMKLRTMENKLHKSFMGNNNTSPINPILHMYALSSTGESFIYTECKQVHFTLEHHSFSYHLCRKICINSLLLIALVFTCNVVATVNQNNEQQSHTNDPGHDGSSHRFWSFHSNKFSLLHRRTESLTILYQPWNSRSMWVWLVLTSRCLGYSLADQSTVHGCI